MKSLLTKNKNALRLIGMTLIFITAFMLFCLRNLDPVTYPSLYAEDGTWFGDLLTRGFYDTAFNTRVFPIVGFIIFLQISSWVIDVFLSGNLYYLPLVLFVLSNMFSAGMVLAAVRVFRGHLPFWGIAAIVLSIALLPIGRDANEIYGRILNLGFMFPYLQTLLLLPLFLPGSRRRLGIAIGLVFSLVSGLTFPVGIGVAGVTCALLLLRFMHERRRGDLVAAILVGLTALLPLLMLNSQSFSDAGAASMPIKVEAWVEFAMARSLLYPIVFWFYSSLTDAFVLLMVVALVAAVAAQLWRTRKSAELPVISAGYPLYLFWGATLVNLAAMLVMRSGLSAIFDGYSSTFPDRYFTGLNLLFFTSLVLTACRNRWGQAVAVALAVPLLATSAGRFELTSPSMHWHSVPTWTKSICGTAMRNGPRAFIPFAPEGFSTEVPKDELTAALLARCATTETRAYADILLISAVVSDDLDKPPSVAAIRYEGQVVRRPAQSGGKDDGWFYVSAGKRRWIVDGKWLETQGLTTADVVQISAAELATIAENPSPITADTGPVASGGGAARPADLYNGHVVRRAPLDGSRQDGWFFVNDGKRRWIADGAWLKGAGLEAKDVQAISAEALSAIPEDPEALGADEPLEGK